MTTTKPASSAGARNVTKRKNPREMFVVAGDLITGPDPDVSRGRRVWIFNISLGGLAFRLSKTLEIGKKHFIRIQAGPIRLDSPIRIVWCRKKDDATHEIGAEFIR